MKEIAVRSRMMLNMLLVTILLATVLGSSPVSASVYGGSCWRNSPPSNDECGSGLICVEWDEDSMLVATDCCRPSELNDLGCSDYCAPVAIDRPVATLPEVPDTAAHRGVRSQKASAASVLEPESPPDAESFLPLLPVRFGGERLSPEAFAELALPEVHYLFRLDDGTGRSSLFAYATWEELARALWETGDFHPREFSKAETAALPSFVGVTLFEGEMWRGAAGRPAEGRSFDLSDGPWHRSVSSLRGFGPGWVTFFDQAGLEGSSLTLSTAWDRPSLKPFGWNDRISSGFVWPRRPFLPRAKALEPGRPTP